MPRTDDSAAYAANWRTLLLVDAGLGVVVMVAGAGAGPGRQRGRRHAVRGGRRRLLRPGGLTGPALGPAAAPSGPLVRVVAGEAKGRRLQAPRGDATRPTSDRVREAIFDMLGSLGGVERPQRRRSVRRQWGPRPSRRCPGEPPTPCWSTGSPAAVAAIRANLAATGLADAGRSGPRRRGPMGRAGGSRRPGAVRSSLRLHRLGAVAGRFLAVVRPRRVRIEPRPSTLVRGGEFSGRSGTAVPW